ncbi:MAG: Fur family transcriptional regulator [Cyclobacteriaceae bacterium]
MKSQSNVTTLPEEVRRKFTEFLESKSLRKTGERYAILEEIYTSEGHYDADSLFLMLKKKHQVSRATVYNTLDLLVECELVMKHQFGKNQAVYEKSWGSRQHDHLICIDCRQVVEFCDPRIQTIQNTVEDLLQFDVLSHSLVLHASCRKSNCKNRPS